MRLRRDRLPLQLLLLPWFHTSLSSAFTVSHRRLGPIRNSVSTWTSHRAAGAAHQHGTADRPAGSAGILCGGDFADPALTDLLLTAARDVPRFGLQDVAVASSGLSVWGVTLRRGRLPTAADFAASRPGGWEEDNGATASTGGESSAWGICWPEEPLFSRFGAVLADLQLPRFVLRHPETCGAVLLGMLRLTIGFVERQHELDQPEDEADELSEDDDTDDDDTRDEDAEQPTQSEKERELPAEELEAIADELAADMASQWGGVIGGVQSLDQLFGSQHGLLNVAPRGEDADGFGLHDGVWRHSGWTHVPELQRRLSSMPELRDLMAMLGRRPSAQGTDINKFSPQVRSSDSSLGVQLDPIERSSINGLTLSGSLSEMLPSEAVLLRGSSPALRRLFLAKKVESKLLSYELSGYADVPTKPRPRPRYFPRLPSAPGGPIIVCLDTSWSMTGDREILAKAVVLECVKAANRQGRDCRVVAFSSESNTMECGLLAADGDGIRRLLDFLSNSFEGGTDVTGALKHAMEALGTETMASADVLLVTDGELPNPPVSDAILETLDRLKERTGMEVHGLLVGKKESAPLERLCTKVHDFLLPYDALASITT